MSYLLCEISFPHFSLCVPANHETMLQRMKLEYVLPVVCVDVTAEHRWVIPPPFLWGKPGRMKQIKAAPPSSAVSLCGDCTGSAAEIKQMQAYTQTNSSTRTRTHIACTHKPHCETEEDQRTCITQLDLCSPALVHPGLKRLVEGSFP